MATERREQKRREKRAQRREKRRSKVQANYRRSAPRPLALARELIGLPKVSEALVDFAEPLLAGLAPDEGIAELRACLIFAATVWNALEDAIANAPDEDQFIEATGRACGPFVGTLMEAGLQREEALELLHELSRRKLVDHLNDRRRIADVQVTATPNGFQVSALATLSR